MDILGTDIPTWLLLLILSAILFYIYSTWTFDTFKKLGIPGPKPWPLVGNSPAFIQQGPDEFYANLKKKYGSMYGIFDGTSPTLVVMDPDMVKQVLIKEFKTFPNRRQLPILDPPLDKCLLVADGELWKRLRSLMTPAFTTGKLRQMTKVINDCAGLMVKNLESHTGSLRSFCFKDHAIAFTTDVISRTAFSVKLDEKTDINNAIVENAAAIFKQDPVKLAFAFTFPGFMNFLRYWLGFRLFHKEPTAFFQRLIGKLIQERQDEKQEHNDFLQMMLNAHESQAADVVDEEVDKGGLMAQAKAQKYTKMTREEMTAQIMLFFLGGTDTTAMSLTFLAYNLALHPEIQQQLTQQIDKFIGSEEVITQELCSKVPYLRQCIQETLRLYPPFKRPDRISTRDIVINGVHIPKGVIVAIPVGALHRDPDFWQNPEKFDPDRFSEENCAIRNALVCLPFGDGPRNCLGKRLALMEMEIAAVKLLQKFQFQTGPDTEIPVKLKKIVVTQPINPILLRITKRY